VSYLSVTNWNKYQHYRNRKPSWIKFHVTLNDQSNPINKLPISHRYLFDRLLLVAAEYANSIPNDSELIARLVGMSSRDCREGLANLQKGRWIKETKSKRRASKPSSRPSSKNARPEAEVERTTAKASSSDTSKVDVTAGLNKNGGGLPFDISFEVGQILAAVTGADDNSFDVLESYAAHLPVGVLVDVRLRAPGKSIKWAVGALKAEAEKRKAPA
jgi:hypothetical protein